MPLSAPVLTIAVIVLFILANAVRILKEYERGVIFRLGRLIGAKGPGLILLIPIAFLIATSEVVAPLIYTLF